MSNLSDRGTLRGTLSVGSESGGTDNYNNLINKPSINSHELVGDQSGDDLGLINSDDLTFNVGHAGSILHNIKYKNKTYTTYAEPFRGATTDSNGTMGLVRAPLASQGDYNKYLKGNGMWANVPLSETKTLFSTTTPITTPLNITLNESIEKAQNLIIWAGVYAAERDNYVPIIFPCKHLTSTGIVYARGSAGQSYYIALGINKISDTQILISYYVKGGWNERGNIYFIDGQY